MPERSAIERFVRHTLGCRCPEEVFERIEIDREAGTRGVLRLAIGGRLLVYVAAEPRRDTSAADLPALLRRGVEDRDANGFNRFRLVLATTDSAALKADAQEALAVIAAGDDKVHLHLVAEADIPAALAPPG